MKTVTIIFILLFSLFLLVSLVFSFEDVKKLSLSAEGIRELQIDAGAGSLKVIGGEGLTAIEVTAEIHVSGVEGKDKEAYFEDHVKLSLDKRGDRAVLESQIEQHHVFLFSGEARIDLTIRMPKDTDLRIDDGSGSMTVEDLKGNVVIEDGSGDIRVERIEGNLEIDDNSGDIDVKEISGDVSIDDGSGSMYVSAIGGNVVVEDGSGSIHIDGVEKDVEIKDAGSGGVHLLNIRGRVRR